MIMRASEFILDEGKASRRKQASMNALRRNANAQKTTAPAAQPTASTGTSAPAVAPTNVGNRPNPYMTPQANIPNASINPTQQAQPTQPTQPTQLTQPMQHLPLLQHLQHLQLWPPMQLMRLVMVKLGKL